MKISDLIKINQFEWEIPLGYSTNMVVPVRIFASQELIEKSLGDKAFEQAINSSSLKGIKKYFCVMPDVHQGYGFPIGGVAAIDYDTGVISPGGIGYDINCGVRLLSSTIYSRDIKMLIEELSIALFRGIPSGVGKGGIVKLTRKDLEEISETGSNWALRKGYATRTDVELTEDQGSIPNAKFSSVSQRAIERGLSQIGSLGSGNHFIEVDVVDEIVDERAARVMGLVEGCLTFQIHSGSRGFGHQICMDFVKEFQTTVHKYHLQIPDRELVCAPIQSEEGQRYITAMRCAANYAFCNRQMLAFRAKKILEEVLSRNVSDIQIRTVYDLAHNIGKIENHLIDGEEKKFCVHRKGATRAFGPNRKEIPSVYQSIGQPVLVPGSMGTSSWVLVGTEEGMEKSFGSCCHGSGRIMSRSKAKKSISKNSLVQQLKEKGIFFQAGSSAGLVEEAPQAYKDVGMVIESVVGSGIAKKVARLQPLVVIKG